MFTLPISHKLDTISKVKACVECKFFQRTEIDEGASFEQYIRDGKWLPAELVPLCARFVDEISGQLRSVRDARGKDGECGPDGWGFKPIKT